MSDKNMIKPGRKINCQSHRVKGQIVLSAWHAEFKKYKLAIKNDWFETWQYNLNRDSWGDMYKQYCDQIFAGSDDENGKL